MKRVLSHIDADLGVLFAWLAEWGILDSTAVILTSDHGMQIGDPSRSGWPPDSLDAAGIRYEPDTGLGIYLGAQSERPAGRAGP
jgi:arylsulfatase A-like enzyme